MNIIQLIFKATLIISLLLSSVGQGYALRPIASKNAAKSLKASSSGRKEMPEDLSELIHFYTEVNRFMHNAELKKENTMSMMVTLSQMHILIEDIQKINNADLLLQRNDLMQDILKTLQHWEETVVPNLAELHTKSQFSTEESGQAMLIIANLYRIYCNYMVSILSYDFRRFLAGNDFLISLATEGEVILSQDGEETFILEEAGEISFASVKELAITIHEKLNLLMPECGFTSIVMDSWNKAVNGNLAERENILFIGDVEAVALLEIAAYEDILHVWQEGVFPKCHEWLDSAEKTKNDRIAICALSMFFDETIMRIDRYVKESLKVDVSPEDSDSHMALLRLKELVDTTKAAHNDFISSVPGPVPLTVMKSLLSVYSIPITHTGVIRDLRRSRPIFPAGPGSLRQIDAAA